MKNYPLPHNLSPFLTKDEWEYILSFSNVKEFRKNNVLFNEGDIADFAGIILSGEILIKKRTEFPNKFFILSVLEKGSFIGENFIVNDAKVRRTVTAQVRENTEIALIDREKWNLLINTNPQISNKLLIFLVFSITNRLSNMNKRIETIF